MLNTVAADAASEVERRVPGLVAERLRVAVAGLVTCREEMSQSARPPSAVMELIVVNRRHHTARSIKTLNLLSDPLLALRNSVTAAGGVAAVSAAGNLLEVARSAVPIDLYGLVTGTLSFLMAAHFARRRDVAYDHACILVLLWSVSAWEDGDHIATFDELAAALPLMVQFGIYDYNIPKAQTAVARLCALGAVAEKAGYLALREVIVVNGG